MALMEPMGRKTIETLESDAPGRRIRVKKLVAEWLLRLTLGDTLSHWQQNEGSLMNNTTIVYKSEEYEGI